MSSQSEILARAERIYRDLIGAVDALYDLAAKADKQAASGHAHRICGSALALRLDVQNATLSAAPEKE